MADIPKKGWDLARIIMLSVENGELSSASQMSELLNEELAESNSDAKQLFKSIIGASKKVLNYLEKVGTL
jgi:hypothetical protein